MNNLIKEVQLKKAPVRSLLKLLAMFLISVSGAIVSDSLGYVTATHGFVFSAITQGSVFFLCALTTADNRPWDQSRKEVARFNRSEWHLSRVANLAVFCGMFFTLGGIFANSPGTSYVALYLVGSVLAFLTILGYLQGPEFFEGC